MKGLIVNFRRGRHTQTTNQMIIQIEGIESKEKAKEFIGKKVRWKSPSGKEINGEIRNFHGGKGLIRALFEKGMPGQSIGQYIEVL